MLYALKTADPSAVALYMDLLRKKEFTQEQIEMLIAFAINNGGIEYASKCMKEYHAKAVDILTSFPDSEAKAALILLADYIIERTK